MKENSRRVLTHGQCIYHGWHVTDHTTVKFLSHLHQHWPIDFIYRCDDKAAWRLECYTASEERCLFDVIISRISHKVWISANLGITISGADHRQTHVLTTSWQNTFCNLRWRSSTTPSETKVMEIIAFLEAGLWNHLTTLTPWLMEPGGSMPHSQGLSNNPNPEPNQPNYPHWYLSLQGPF